MKVLEYNVKMGCAKIVLRLKIMCQKGISRDKQNADAPVMPPAVLVPSCGGIGYTFSL